MKKTAITLAMTLAGLLMFASASNARGQASAQRKSTAKNAASMSAPMAMTMTGIVSADENVLVTDRNNKTWTVSKSWTVTNPAALKGQAGNHVSVSANIDPEKGTIHVVSVKLLAQESPEPPAEKN